MNIEQVLAKHQYVQLNKKERKASRATHQHKSMYEMEERYALTLNLVDADHWLCFDHRGDLALEGYGPEQLDKLLSSLIDEEEDSVDYTEC